MRAIYYTLELPYSLWAGWDWFEHRGYLPEMPGEPLEDVNDVGPGPYSGQRSVVVLGLTEAEAWEFSESSEELGEAFLSCVAETESIVSLLERIV